MWLPAMPLQCRSGIAGSHVSQQYDPTCYATEILDAKYEKVEVDEEINQLNYLTL
jgi:hypothetical protein